MADFIVSMKVTGVKDAEAAMRKFGKSVQDAGKSAESVSGKSLDLGNITGQLSQLSNAGGIGGLLGGALSTAIPVAGLGVATAAMAGASWELGKLGAESLRTKEAFNDMAAGAGTSGKSMLSAMREASRGTVSDAELMASANRALVLGVASDAGTMAKLVEAAIVRGRQVGVGAAQAVNDLVTGIGRMSPEILDNLGIANAKNAFADYAKTLGTTADKLTDVQKKAALVNSVLESTGGAAVVDDAASSFERMDAAIQNAKAALGELFSPAIAAIAQQLADTVNAAMDVKERPAMAMQLADMRKQLQDATTEWLNLKRAQEEGSNLPFAKGNAGFAEGRASWDGQPSAAAAPDTGAIDAAKKKMDELGAAILILEARSKAYASGMAELDPKLDRTREKIAAQGAAATAASQQIVAAQTAAKYSADNFSDGIDRLSAAVSGGAVRTNVLSASLGTLASAAGGAIGIVYSLTGAINQLNAATGVMQSNSLINDAATSQINGIGAGLVASLGLDAALDKTSQLKVEHQKYVDGLRDAGYTTAEITVASQAWLANQQKISTEVGKTSSGLSDAQKAYDDLKSKVAGVLQGATSLDSIGVDPSKYLPKGDAIQEDAFRLADVMVKGFDSPWVDYFKIQFPKMWAEISANGDIKAGAAKVLQEFQAGMRPDLLNFDQLKETVKQQLLSEQAFAGMSQQITDQLVAELGVSAGQVQSALAGVAGGLPGGEALTKGAGADMTGTGNEAGTTFMAGFSASTNGASVVTTITTQIQAVIGQFNTSGRKAGEQWSTGFYAVAETSLAGPLVNLLATLVTPIVLANIAAGGSRNGAR